MTRTFPSLRVLLSLSIALIAFGLAAPSPVAAAAKLRVLLVTGGCCHDYAAQKDILKKGLEERANVVVDIVYSDDSSTHPPLPILGNPDYAKGYDLVIHDECAADISDPKLVEGVLKPHLDGIPGVNLHCAMHCYRIGNPNDPVTPGTPHGYWFEYLGLQSSGHGPQEPISIKFTDNDSPIVKGMKDWTTIHEEHYNNIHVFDTAHALAHGTQVIKRQNGASRTNDFVVVWTNEYGPNKTRVFSTTIGHNNETVSDPRYLDLVARGVLWATGHINEDGTPTPATEKTANNRGGVREKIKFLDCARCQRPKNSGGATRASLSSNSPMLKYGILNPALASLLCRFRHTNWLVIADRGFPHWPQLETVDISLTDNIPTVRQVLAALRDSYAVGAAVMAAEVERENPRTVLQEYQSLLPSAKIKFIPHVEFKKRVPGSIGLVRTGDTTQYGNILVQSG